MRDKINPDPKKLLNQPKKFTNEGADNSDENIKFDFKKYVNIGKRTES